MKDKSAVMRVFVCSPYSGNVLQNVENAKKFTRYVLNAGCAAYTPHLYLPLVLDDENEAERTQGINCGLAFMECISQCWVFAPEGDISPGMKKEIEYARRIGVTVFVVGQETIKDILSK